MLRPAEDNMLLSNAGACLLSLLSYTVPHLHSHSH